MKRVEQEMKSQEPKQFLESLMARLYDSLWALPRNNYDYYRFGPEKKLPLRWRYKAPLAKLLNRLGLLPPDLVEKKIQSALAWIQPIGEELEWLFHELADEASRDTLIDVVAYRSLGYRHVKFPLNTPEYWERLQRIDAEGGARVGNITGFPDWSLRAFELDYASHHLRVATTPKAILTQFELDQYKCLSGSRCIAASSGDVALDCGGCWGDTALNLACRVGPTGKVHSFEFIPGNLAVLRQNLRNNPAVQDRVKIHERAVWEITGQRFFYEDRGPASRVFDAKFDGMSGEVESISIDDFITSEELDRVNFIKMDIEGAELWALRGGRHTLAKHKPKLAISVYHRPSDLIDIPKLIKSICPAYDLYLRHFTIHAEETVLFAEVPE